jgi:hypothetical protein
VGGANANLNVLSKPVYVSIKLGTLIKFSVTPPLFPLPKCMKKKDKVYRKAGCLGQLVKKIGRDTKKRSLPFSDSYLFHSELGTGARRYRKAEAAWSAREGKRERPD